jgi:integrase
MIGYSGPKPDGSWGEIRESAKTQDENAARGLLEKRLRAVENHREGVKTFEGPNAARLTVGDILDSLKSDWESRDLKGLSTTASHMSRIREAFGSRKAMSITTDQLRRYVQTEKATGTAAATINRRLEVLGRAFRLAVEERRLAYVPKIPYLAENNARQGFFEKDEFDRVVRLLPAPLNSMAHFGFLTGWRRGELLGLRWECVDRVSREIRIPDSKNGEPRSLPLDDELWTILEALWVARKYETDAGPALSPFVFHRRGKPVNRHTFADQWRAACVEAKVPGKLFHDLRRTAARNLVRGGVPETVAMKITGHKTRSMFDRYNISDDRDKLEALAKSRAYVSEQEQKAKEQQSKVVGIDSHPDSHSRG